MKLVYVILYVIALSGCAGPQIKSPNATLCTTAGILPAGADCATTNTGEINELSFLEFVDFLEPQPERNCVQKAGFQVCASDQGKGEKVTLAARGGAVCESDDDFTAQKDAFEQACAELKDRCTPEMKAKFEIPYERMHSLIHSAVKKKGL